MSAELANRMIDYAKLMYADSTRRKDIEIFHYADALMQFASEAQTEADEVAPVAWLHPEAGWAHTDRNNVASHCWKDGPEPIPLYRAPPIVGPDGWSNLSCDDQFALATRIAANVGYVLVPEPEIDP